jgi:hypothetical protein
MKKLLFCLATALATCTSSAAQTTDRDLIGCLTSVPGGGLQLQVRPSGSVYLIEGRAPVNYVNELIRVRGQIHPGASNKQVLTLDQVELVNQSCATALAAQQPVSVVGKVGEGQMAVPVTTSASADETTPGFQTEGIEKQEPPQNGRAAPRQRRNSQYAPGHIAQAAQSAAVAELYAASATRTEIVPGNTLGVDTMPDYSSTVSNKTPAQAPRQR